MALIVVLIEFLLDDYIREGKDLKFHTWVFSIDYASCALTLLILLYVCYQTAIDLLKGEESSFLSN